MEMANKPVRKNIRLTEFQIKRLQELSEFDGLDQVEHVKRAIDSYLNRQKTDFVPTKEDDIVVELKNRTSDSEISRAIWLMGTVAHYEFSALILNVPAKSGIDKGRITKLSIWDPVIRGETDNFIGSCIVNYDRGWDIRPSILAEPFYRKVKVLVDQYIEQLTPKRVFQ